MTFLMRYYAIGAVLLVADVWVTLVEWFHRARYDRE